MATRGRAADPLDKAGRTIEISATVSEAVANAFQKQKALPKEGSLSY
jgi:hypothetical protein